jgi:cell division protein FtsL
MLTFKSIAAATLLGAFLVALLVCLLGMSQGIVFAEHQARALLGVRPF